MYQKIYFPISAKDSSKFEVKCKALHIFVTSTLDI